MKQSAVDGQATLTGVTLLGPEWSVQVVPPSVVVSTSPVAPSPFRSPVARQVLADGQAIARSVKNPLGMLWLVRVVPLFVVAMSTPVPENVVPLPPTAKHAVVEGQAMPSR
jgi:hypothetical protein